MSTVATEHPIRIGLVEDNDDLRESLAEVLLANGYHCNPFSSAEDLKEAGDVTSFDLLLVDLNLPGEDGLSLTARLKRVMPRLRVIMMTTRGEVSDRVRGYETGADIYLPKPLAVSELLAAVRALGRQVAVEARDTGAAAILDRRSQQLFGPHEPVRLNAIEATALAALACAPGQTLEHWQLLELSGAELDESTKANLAVRMTRLRGKLDQAGLPRDTLRALRGTGYQLCLALTIH